MLLRSTLIATLLFTMPAIAQDNSEFITKIVTTRATPTYLEKPPKPLPSGWENKLLKGNILDDEVFRRSQPVSYLKHPNLPFNEKGKSPIDVEGKLISIYTSTHEILAVLK